MDLSEPVESEGAPRVRVVEALVVRPGDHLLVSIREHHGMTREQATRLRDLLREQFPGVEVTLLAGASVALHRPEDPQADGSQVDGS